MCSCSSDLILISESFVVSKQLFIIDVLGCCAYLVVVIERRVVSQHDYRKIRVEHLLLSIIEIKADISCEQPVNDVKIAVASFGRSKHKRIEDLTY